MHVQLLNAHFAQLVTAWKKSKYNKYSDSDKQEYHNCLSALFEKLKNEDFNILKNDSQKEEVKVILQFFFTSLEFLDNSTINIVPFELIYCLKEAMIDSIPNHDDYIIVTSFNRFSFNSALARNKIYSIIEAKYNIHFNKRLVQINLPRYLSRDYLTNSVLYHELGHFVDFTLKISDAIAIAIVDDYLDTSKNATIKNDIIKYFPFLQTNYILEKKFSLAMKLHIEEYFSDIFASQYVDKSVYHYLIYETENYNTFDVSHPLTKDRINIVDEFLDLSKPHGYVIQKFIEESFKFIKDGLGIRYNKIKDESDILELIPCEITQKEQLHYLFHLGWEIWLNKTEEFKTKNEMTEDLKPGHCYQIINNLIEKSISNFIITESWIKSKECI